MKKEQALAAALRAKYQPTAIVLHGSRAAGMSRPHSDWDFCLLYQDKTHPAVTRELIDGENLEWQAYQIPMTDERLLELFGPTMQYGKVVWEAESAGTQFVEQAARIYSRGVPITAAERAKHKLQLVDKLHSLQDCVETPYLFLRSQADFLRRAIDTWFLLRGRFGKPYYVAVPQIQIADPEYAALMMVICGDDSSIHKVKAAQQIVFKLFPEPDASAAAATVMGPHESTKGPADKEQAIVDCLVQEYQTAGTDPSRITGDPPEPGSQRLEHTHAFYRGTG